MFSGSGDTGRLYLASPLRLSSCGRLSPLAAPLGGVFVVFSRMGGGSTVYDTRPARRALLAYIRNMPPFFSIRMRGKSYMRCLSRHTPNSYFLNLYDEVCRRRCLPRPRRHGEWVRGFSCIDFRCENVRGCPPSHFDVHVASCRWCTRSVVRSPHNVYAVRLDE